MGKTPSGEEEAPPGAAAQAVAPAVAAQACSPNGKTGTAFTATMLLISAAGGIGGLAIPHAMAWFGWPAGLTLIIVFGLCTGWSVHMLRRLYRVGDVEFARYHHLVEHVLGPRAAVTVAGFQATLMVIAAVGIVLAGAEAFSGAAHHLDGVLDAQWERVLVIAVVELALSQIPSLGALWWVGTLATLLAGAYSLIAIILGCLGASNLGGTVDGIDTDAVNKTFGVLSALGTLGVAYSFCELALEISDTLRQPPAAAKTMKVAVNAGVSAASLVYLGIAITSYLALGNDAPGFVFDGYYDIPGVPQWLVLVGVYCVAIQSLLTFQIWAQPMFATLEGLVLACLLRRRQAKAAATPPSALPGGTALPALAEDESVEGEDVERGPAIRPLAPNVSLMPSPFDLQAPANGAQLASNRFCAGSRLLSVRGTGESSVFNSGPMLDVRPLPGWRPSRLVFGAESTTAASAPSVPSLGSSWPASTGLASLRVLSSRLPPLSLSCSIVPEVEVAAAGVGVRLAWWERAAIRCSYVLVIILAALLIPFFSLLLSLGGALTWFPLNIATPHLAYRAVYRPTGAKSALMWLVFWGTFAASAAAAVASVRQIVQGWTDVVFFE